MSDSADMRKRIVLRYSAVILCDQNLGHHADGNFRRRLAPDIHPNRSSQASEFFDGDIEVIQQSESPSLVVAARSN